MELDQKMCLKRTWCCSFQGQRNLARERFLGGKHLTSSSTKTAKSIIFKLCTHVSNRLLHKTVPAFFLIMCYSFFYCNNSMSFASVFCMKTVKKRLFKKIFEKKKMAGMLLFISWLAKYKWKKLLKTTILSVQELIK